MGTETPSIILITGASRGIGLALVRQYLATGSWRVHACCRRPDRAEDLRRVAADSDGRVVVHPLDVTDTPRIRALAKELSAEPIDVLLNNAGVYGGRESGLGHVDEKVWLADLRRPEVKCVYMQDDLLERPLDQVSVAHDRFGPELRRALRDRFELVASEEGYFIYRLRR